MTDSAFITRVDLTAGLARLGVAAGDIVMVHAACRAVGPVLGGADAIIAALRDAVGAEGTVMAYLDWEAAWEDFKDEHGRIPAALRPHVLPFDPALTRAARQNGTLPEFLRTTPGARRSANPGASVAALGARADWLTADHPMDYGYGPGTPLARLVEARGKVLMLGAPLDTHDPAAPCRAPGEAAGQAHHPHRGPLRDGGRCSVAHDRGVRHQRPLRACPAG
jgi:aminoglycoside 3-N-acetyltransferase